MLDSLQVSTLLSSPSVSSSSGLSGLFSNKETTLATVTEGLLNAHFNIEQPAATVAFSQELVSFISENLESGKADALLADIAAIEQLSSLGENDSNSITNQLLGSTNGSGKVLDLLI